MTANYQSNAGDKNGLHALACRFPAAAQKAVGFREPDHQADIVAKGKNLSVVDKNTRFHHRVQTAAHKWMPMDEVFDGFNGHATRP